MMNKDIKINFILRSKNYKYHSFDANNYLSTHLIYFTHIIETLLYL